MIVHRVNPFRQSAFLNMHLKDLLTLRMGSLSPSAVFRVLPLLPLLPPFFDSAWTESGGKTAAECNKMVIGIVESASLCADGLRSFYPFYPFCSVFWQRKKPFWVQKPFLLMCYHRRLQANPHIIARVFYLGKGGWGMLGFQSEKMKFYKAQVRDVRLPPSAELLG